MRGRAATRAAQLSDFAVVPYGQDQSARLDFQGSDVRNPATEGDTPVGELQHEAFQFTFNGFLKVTFQGSRVTSDAGLILVRELDERLGLATLISEHLSDSRRTRAPRRRASRARASRSPCSGPIEGSDDDLVPKAAAEAIRTAREKGPSGVIAGGPTVAESSMQAPA